MHTLLVCYSYIVTVRWMLAKDVCTFTQCTCMWEEPLIDPSGGIVLLPTEGYHCCVLLCECAKFVCPPKTTDDVCLIRYNR